MPQAAAKRALWQGFNKGARSASKADNQPVCSREQVFNLDLEAARQHQDRSLSPDGDNYWVTINQLWGNEGREKPVINHALGQTGPAQNSNGGIAFIIIISGEIGKAGPCHIRQRDQARMMRHCPRLNHGCDAVVDDGTKKDQPSS